MVLFFYGQDSYRRRQKINQLKEKFISASLGDTNLAVLEGKTATFEEISRQILALPFLARKRLVILENILIEGKKEVQEKMVGLLEKIPDSTVFVLADFGLPDRRTALFRKLNLSGRAQEFKLLEGENLRRWVCREVLRCGGEIESGAITKLIEYVGNDLWRMSNEIAKLTAYNQQLTAQDVELLVQPQVKSNIFNLVEATARRQKTRAFHELYKLFYEGLAEIYILTMLVYQYRNLLVVKDAQEQSLQASRFELKRKVGLHPYVLAKTLALTGKYSLLELKKIYERLLDFESAIKVGKMEARLALELLVFELTK